ncbi:hypothetical protein Lal_00042535 [Lupinus albus]|nr:hypothetical protein Lal_00042535 [Lupinus albus]
MQCSYYPELVRVFYCNLTFMKNKIFSYVKGKELAIDFKMLSSIYSHLPFTRTIVEARFQCDLEGYIKKDFYYSMCSYSKREIDLCKQRSVGETVRNRDILSTGNLNLEDHLLHYLLSYVIVPKFSNHSKLRDMELQLMYALKHNVQINWTLMIMRQMWTFTNNHRPLPYAMLITAILEHFDMSSIGESKILLDAWDNKIDVDVIQKMGLFRDPIDMIKNSMPSNQMIMDELFSLRCYITTRMDAHDAANQQVQMELQCLSNQMDYMDLFDESTEPE